MSVTLWQDALEIIAQESGLEPAEILETDDMEFARLGVDSILATAILSHLRGPRGEALPQDIFNQKPTVGALRRFYETSIHLTIAPTLTPAPTTKLDRKATPVPLSILLQNDPVSSRHTVFLLPDGSGSAMAYANLTLIHPEVCVVGMNSPYLREAGSYRCSVEDLAAKWVLEIYRRQPQGPYSVGGWSAGGYYSYEVAKRLLQDGHAVDRLILIDSPSRNIFEPLSMEVVNYLSSRNLMGNWGSREVPQWLVEHFRFTLAAVGNYSPRPIDSAGGMETYIIWSRDGVLDQDELAKCGLDLSVKVSRFVLQGKDNLGPNGWEELVPSKKIAIGTQSGTHLTMMNDPHMSQMSHLLRDAVVGITPGRQSHWQRVIKA
ncbi:polyketide synthase [Metarhizium album ARSEF 1941]|uniref:Polyketide synthase n=1 Tax=Metarhizium album (strain ARSEF 1941) TaxID=1081103 RepID=A0A0B2WMZ1_METAS|nr:polyketide synthase [Metarhizium album ARSEF 1941]KHN94380.1 polyketide synthase [Metarhizium album ARSEF 1941]